MYRQGKTVVVVFAVLALFFIGGCAKKKIQTTPSGEGYEQGMAKGGKEGAQAREGEERKEGIDEYQLSQEERKRQAQLEKEKKASEEQRHLEKMDVLKKKIHFAFDSYELNPKARDLLKKKAKILKRYPELKMIIEGHCDERGTEEYNLALGERRARTAYEFLILLGVDAERLRIISYGEEKPIDPAHNETAWAKNRRDEFKIIK